MATDLYGTIPEDLAKEIASIKEPRTMFIVPSVEEVEEYMRTLHILDPRHHASKFWHHYNAVNWFVGRKKMVDWKSAVVKWDLPRTSI